MPKSDSKSDGSALEAVEALGALIPSHLPGWFVSSVWRLGRLKLLKVCPLTKWLCMASCFANRHLDVFSVTPCQTNLHSHFSALRHRCHCPTRCWPWCARCGMFCETNVPLQWNFLWHDQLEVCKPTFSRNVCFLRLDLSAESSSKSFFPALRWVN